MNRCPYCFSPLDTAGKCPHCDLTLVHPPWPGPKPVPHQTGWVCPRCGRVNAPWVSSCCQPPPVVTCHPSTDTTPLP